MRSKLKSIVQHDKEIISNRMNPDKKKEHSPNVEKLNNGIACPAENCGNEMTDSILGEVIDGNIPRKSIHCSKCGHKNFRFI